MGVTCRSEQPRELVYAPHVPIQSAPRPPVKYFDNGLGEDKREEHRPSIPHNGLVFPLLAWTHFEEEKGVGGKQGSGMHAGKNHAFNNHCVPPALFTELVPVQAAYLLQK